MTDGWSRGDVFFVSVIAVTFLFLVVVPAVRRHRATTVFDPDPAPVVLLRRWRRPPG